MFRVLWGWCPRTPLGKPGSYFIYHTMMGSQSRYVQGKCTVKYQDLDAAVQMILEEKGDVFLASCNFSSGFRHCPLHPRDFPLLVMKAQHLSSGRTYFLLEKALSFACGIFCALFTRVSNAISHCDGKECQKAQPIVYLDDFLFCNSTVFRSNQNLPVFLDVCEATAFLVSGLRQCVPLS